MQNMNNALRLGTFISQLEAGRSEQIAAMVVEATLPYGHLDDDWPGRGGRKVGKPSRALAKPANPKRGLSEAQLLELLQDTFAQYTAIAGDRATGSIRGVPVLADVRGVGVRPYAQHQGAPR
jgi:hypothetical protein